MWYSFWMTNRWLLLHFDALGAVGVWITTLFALSGYVDAGLAGVCITSAMSFTNSVYWACRFWTALELDLKYVNHCFLYLQSIDKGMPARSNVLLNISISPKSRLQSSKTTVRLLTGHRLPARMKTPSSL